MVLAGHYRFADSRGIDVWTKGQATLLKDCVEGHITTGAVRTTTNKRPFQSLRSIQWTTGGTVLDGCLLHDEYDVDKIKVDDPNNPVHFIDYNSGTDSPVYAICDNGTTAFWITNTATKKTVYKKSLDLDETTAGAVVFDEAGAVSNAIMEYVKSLPEKKFEMKFDNIALLRKNKNVWEVYKVYEKA